MQRRMAVRRLSVVLGIFVGMWTAAGSVPGAEKAAEVATVAAARKVLDLETFPLMEGAETPSQRNLAGLTYAVASNIETAYGFQKKELLQRGWQELPGGSVTDQYASGSFSKAGFVVSLSAFPQGKNVMITFIQHGNVDLAKLPILAGTKLVYGGPVSLMVLTEKAPEQTHQDCAKKLVAAGWQPYGDAGDVRFYKQNAVQLSLMAAESPAQAGKTMIQLQTVLMSADLPAPPDSVRLQYSDSTTALSGDSTQSLAEVEAYYRKTLAAQGWKATTEKPLTIDHNQVVIFRNSAKDLLELKLHTFEEKSRFLLTHQAAAKVAEEERLAKAALEKKNTPQPSASVPIELPPPAENVQTEKAKIEFELKSGTAKATMEGWIKGFEKQGWKVERTVSEKAAGVLALTKEGVTISLNYVDPGFIPAEVTLGIRGGEFVVGAKK